MIRREEENDYWSIVLRQLRKNKIGLAGLAVIFILFLVAVFAPFLAESIPIRFAHSNDSDETCRICVALGDTRDVLKLKDGRTLEGKLVRELPDGHRFQTTTQPEWYADAEVEKLEFEHDVVELNDGTKIGGTKISETDAEIVLESEERFQKVRRAIPRADVKSVGRGRMPDGQHRLKVKSGQVVMQGTYFGREAAYIEFVSGGEKIKVAPADKISLDVLPRRHDTMATWPLLRGLQRVDLALLLSLAVLILMIALFRWFRLRGLQRGAAFARAALWLAVPVGACVIGIVVWKSERQRFNLVDFSAYEGKLGRGSMLWPVVPFNASTEDKHVIPYQKPTWIRWSLEDQELATKLFGPEYKVQAKKHILGTDKGQRDMFAMLVHGTRISLSVGFLAVAIYVTIGIIIGAIAGFFGGWTDDVIMRVIEIVICFPTFFLIITIVAVAPPSIFWVMGAIALVQWTTVARLVRAEFLRLRKNDFVTSARALGASKSRIIFRHVLPNALSPVLVSATFGIAGAILTESALSFLGIGVPLDVATWGKILRQGQEGLPKTWWLALIPGIAIFVTVTAYNLFGEALRDALDPRLKGTS
jgi:peptide/nickel transport system permease protein